MINIVAIQPSHTGNLRVYKSGETPTGGVLNFAPVVPSMNNSNSVFVDVSSEGEIDVFVNAPSNDGNPTLHVRGVILAYQ